MFAEVRMQTSTWRLVVAMLATLGVAWGLGAASQPAYAAFPGTNGRIAFSTLSELDIFNVFTVNPDGSAPTDLTAYGVQDEAPAVSPDGVRIAFTSDRDGNQEIYVMDADGTNVTRVTTNPARDFDPAFSADGSRIGFVSDRDGNEEIYSIRLDGSGLTRLTTSAASEEDPAFSADGSRLAFTSNRDGNREIYLSAADGTNPVRLTTDPAADYQPDFSPDGSRIVFTSERAGGVAHLYMMGASGSSPTLLTSDPTSADHDASFSPDGTKIAFASDAYCPPGYACGDMLGGTVLVTGSNGSGGRTAVGGYAPLASPDWGVGTPAGPPPDATPPDTTLTPGPSGPTNNPAPTFAFAGTDNLTPPAGLQYSFRVDSGAWSNYSPTTSATLTLPDGAHTFAVRARDEAGNQDPTPAQRSFTVDTVAPAGTVTIQGGAAQTRTLTVTLTLSAADPAPASGVTAMRIANTSSRLLYAGWTSYATGQAWTLTAGAGTKTVYVQYRDAAGNVSPVTQDAISYKP